MSCKRLKSSPPEIDHGTDCERSKLSTSSPTISISDKNVSYSSTHERIGRNHDFLIQLLVHVPANTLVSSYKFICKLWRSVISPMYFSKYHTLHHQQSWRSTSFILGRDFSRFLCFSTRTEILERFTFDSAFTKILQSSHGLLLLECRKTKYGRKQYCVCNPTTRQCRDLLIESFKLSGLCLAYDPSESLHYRVVAVRYIFDREYRVHVYDSMTHTWKKFKVFTIKNPANFYNGIYLNNRIYWMRFTMESFYLDLETGVLKYLPTIEAPPTKRGEKVKNDVTESNGHIYSVSIRVGNMTRYLLVHEMSDNGKRWFPKYHIDLTQISCVFAVGRASVLGIIRGEKDGDFTLWIHLPGTIIPFMFRDGKLEPVSQIPDTSLEFENKNGCRFIESLARV